MLKTSTKYLLEWAKNRRVSFPRGLATRVKMASSWRNSGTVKQIKTAAKRLSLREQVMQQEPPSKKHIARLYRYALEYTAFYICDEAAQQLNEMMGCELETVDWEEKLGELATHLDKIIGDDKRLDAPWYDDVEDTADESFPVGADGDLLAYTECGDA